MRRRARTCWNPSYFLNGRARRLQSTHATDDNPFEVADTLASQGEKIEFKGWICFYYCDSLPTLMRRWKYWNYMDDPPVSYSD